MSEEKWLETREALQFISGRCYIYDRKGNVCPNPESDLMPREDPLYSGRADYRDAAEFSERVAERLAEALSGRTTCAPGECMSECRRHWLKWARLHIEREMDNAAV